MARFKFAGGGGGAATWTEIGYSDTAANSGNYTFSHSASGAAGFAHSITVDTGANSYYLDIRECASVYFDTGLTYADLAAYNQTIIGFAMETSLDNTHAQATDGGAFFNFGLYMTDNTTLSSGAIGGWGGIGWTNSLGIRTISQMGRFTNDNIAGTGLGAFSDYNYSSGEKFKGMFLDASIRLGTATNSGPQGVSIGYQYEPAAGGLAGDRTMYQRATTPVGTGPVILGAMFGQRVVGSGVSKSMDFNLYYSIVSR